MPAPIKLNWMKSALTFSLLLAPAFLCAQAESFDVFNFTLPAGWQGEPMKDSLRIGRNQDGRFCLFDFYRNLRGSGNLERDFQTEWQSLVAKFHQLDSAPQVQKGDTQDGWQSQAGGTTYTFEGTKNMVVMVTFSKGPNVASIVMLSNDEGCADDFSKFLSTLSLKPGAANPPAPSTNQTVNTGFAFDTMKFKSGWVSQVQKDWVLGKKENLTVRLHYANAALTGIAAPGRYLYHAWNTLIAPRYRDLQGFKQDFARSGDSQVYMASATGTSVETGQRVFVSLFQLEYSAHGDSGWIEIVTPDRQTFVQKFGVEVDTLAKVGRQGWNAPDLRGLNHFPVAASDLKGAWMTGVDITTLLPGTDPVTGLPQILAGGPVAGFTSRRILHLGFGPNNTYGWAISETFGMIGSRKNHFSQSKGTFSLNGNGQIRFSDMEGRPRVFDSYFVALRDGRELWLRPVEAKPTDGWDDYKRYK